MDKEFYLKFGEKCVQAMDFLSLLDKGIILRDAFQSEFIHQINFVRVTHMFLLQK